MSPADKPKRLARARVQALARAAAQAGSPCAAQSGREYTTDYREIVDLIPYRAMIYSGPIDVFFDYRYGKLPYRSLNSVWTP